MIALLKYCFSFTKKLILVAAVLSLVICLFGYFIEKDKPKIAHDPIAESRKSLYAKINNKEEIVTHRIYRIGGNVYLTKGDNNAAIDEYKILPRLIIGQVVAIIPNLGYIFSFAKSPIGVILVIIFPAVCFILCEVVKIKKIVE